MKLCLLTESTYPYHVGGVSTWTHTLLQGIPDVEVVLVPLCTSEVPRSPLWTLPPNVSTLCPMRVPNSLVPADIMRWSEQALSDLPRTDLTHALTAGVAGQLGRALKAARGTPLLVTEHGIGWHELQHGASETETGFRPDAPTATTNSCVAEQAIEQTVHNLKHLARAVYEAADGITAVAWSTREKQLTLGADPTHSRVIPNGVGVSSHPPALPKSPPFHVGFVGRLTPLKDVHTFLRACARVHDALPETHFSVVGPPSDPAYAAQCHEWARGLGLSDRLTFVGNERDMAKWYQRFDVVALTSRSEAQPLAVLEAMAHARPVVVTDVGDCRRLVTGPNDVYGPAGEVCAPGDDKAIGAALLALARTPRLRRDRSRASWLRVRAFHQRDQMTAAYRRLYTRLVSSD